MMKYPLTSHTLLHLLARGSLQYLLNHLSQFASILSATILLQPLPSWHLGNIDTTWPLLPLHKVPLYVPSAPTQMRHWIISSTVRILYLRLSVRYYSKSYRRRVYTLGFLGLLLMLSPVCCLLTSWRTTLPLHPLLSSLIYSQHNTALAFISTTRFSLTVMDQHHDSHGLLQPLPQAIHFHLPYMEHLH
jgi:hypothetical protein